MRLMRGSFGLLLLCAFTAAVQAQQGIAYRRVLLPVVVDTPVAGAFGSQWQTDLGLSNVGTSAMWVYPI